MTRLIGRIWKSGDTRRRPVLMGRGLDGYFDIRSLALCGFEGPGRGWSRPVSGGYGEGETPLPIPNRAVKPLSADGTWPARAWESRSPPVLLYKPRLLVAGGVFFVVVLGARGPSRPGLRRWAVAGLVGASGPYGVG